MSYTIHHPKEKASDKMKFHRSKHLWPERQDLMKPQWLRKKVRSSERIDELISLFQSQELVTVCQEASCPNLVECFDHKIATFMIMGSLCTRRCSFCDVGHGRPLPLDPEEPERLAKTVLALGLKYVVITSVDRDDLVDGGAQHFVNCIKAVREYNPDIIVECLVPDFRGRQALALDIFSQAQPDVFNHNIETVPSLYLGVRPGSDYHVSLNLLKSFKMKYPDVPTKSGIMLGLGETKSELEQTLQDLRAYLVDGVTIGQYLPPSAQHYPLMRYVTPEEFHAWEIYAKAIGFSNVASGTFVRSSYQAEVFSQNLLS